MKAFCPFTPPHHQGIRPGPHVWGGDSPHIVDVHMKGYSQADIAKVKGGNLKRLLNW